jgi:Zn-dependent peptidase ImmA (M78 family)
MTFGSAFKDVLGNRGIDITELSLRADISDDTLRTAIDGNKELTEDQLDRIADELGVPMRALFANTALPISDIPDFRRKNVGIGRYDKGTIKAIGYVEKLSGSLASLPLDLSLDTNAKADVPNLSRSAAKKLASKWRLAWGVTDNIQVEWKSSHKMYASLRGFIEATGVFVLHYSFGGQDVSGIYTKIGDGPHTIVINTTGSNKARKLFTLAHEFCHVLLRANGASNVSVSNNKVERFCNQFAAYLLAPESVISNAISRYNYTPSLSGDFVRLLSKNLGISQQCCVLRLVEMDIFTSAQYGAWIGRFNGGVPEGDIKDGAGGQGDPIQNKQTQYGASLLTKLSEAKSKGFLDDIDIFRLAGIKPKYQNALLGGV